MEITTHSTEETKKLAFELAPKLKSGSIVALYGDLGSGKTTFTSFLVSALGIKARVQSPTFVIARKYKGSAVNVNHIDLYRLSTLKEAKDIGILELFNEERSISVIEWPEIVEDLLPSDAVKIFFTQVSETERKIDVQNLS
jgi:tRNA threonylcarbamoyladenosine biosynthesis protein TsaE